MLERFALTAAAHQLTQAAKFCLIQMSLELKVNIEPLFAKEVCDELFCILSRMFDPAFTEICGGGLQHLQDSHAHVSASAKDFLAWTDKQESKLRERTFLQSLCHIGGL